MVILLTNVVKLSSFVEKPCWNLPGKGKVQNVNSRMLNGWCWRCGYKWPVAVCVGFFFYNPVLWFCRMENTVLGNALDGVPEESSEEGEKQNDSKIESADNLDGWC